jgi:hypothetical protein
VSDTDKILLSFYHLLKAEGFPISLFDLLKYTRITKFRFLKLYRNTFHYAEKTNEYYRAIYERCIKMAGNTADMNFPYYLRHARMNICSDPRELCIACIIKHSDGSIRLKDIPDLENEERCRIRKTLGKLNRDE